MPENESAATPESAVDSAAETETSQPDEEPVRIYCPRCEKKAKALPSELSRVLECPSCAYKGPFTQTPPGSGFQRIQSDAYFPPHVEEDPGTTRRAQIRRETFRGVLVVTILFVLLALAGGLVLYLRGATPDTPTPPDPPAFVDLPVQSPVLEAANE